MISKNGMTNSQQISSSNPDWLVELQNNEESIVKNKVYVRSASKETETSETNNKRTFKNKLKSLKPPKQLAKPSLNQQKEEEKETFEGQHNALNERGSISQTVDYLNSDQLTPLVNPKLEWQRATEEIKRNTNWLEQFETCTTVRRLCKHHKDVLLTSTLILSEFVKNLLKLIDSLRSCLSKNALLLLNDLFISLKSLLEPNLEQIIAALLRKSTETGSFLGPHALDALKSMCENCSEGRIITILMNFMNGGNKVSAQVKARVVYCFNNLVKKIGKRLTVTKEGERLISALALALSEGAIEVRNAAKEGLGMANEEVKDSGEFDRLLQRAVASKVTYKKIVNLLTKPAGQSVNPEEFFMKECPPRQSKVQFKLLGKPFSFKRLKTGGRGLLQSEVPTYTKPKELSDLKIEASGVKKISKKYTPTLEEPEEFDRIPTLVTGISSSDWRTRLNSIDELIKLSERTADKLKKSSKFIVVYEALVKVLTDSNAKVSLKAITAMEKFIPSFKIGIEQNIQMLLSGLSTNLCSTNSALKNKSEILIDLLIDTIESVYLVQPFINIALYENIRARPSVIFYLCGISIFNSLRNIA